MTAPTRSTQARLGRAAADGAGRAIAGAVAVVTAVRSVDKPMHPLGEVLTARLVRPGGGRSGVAFLDEAGEDDVLVRFSRSIGLPAPWPDVDGLAVRVPTPGAAHPHADVLMSGTGRGRVTRYLLVPTLKAHSAFLGTLLPYRSASGPVHLGARALDEHTWELAWARPSGEFTTFATLELTAEPGRDLSLSFDAVGAGLPGLDVYDWHKRVRDPSYARARRARGTVSPHQLDEAATSQATTGG